MSKHTPGPYHIIDNAFPGLNRKDRPIVDDAGDTIAVVRGDGVAESIRDANARLFRAAPDLLASLRDMRAIIHDYLTHAEQGKNAEAIARADAAIARAEGGAQ